MHPTLIRIPFLNLTIWSFGAMAVVGFLMALLLVRHMSRRAGLDARMIADVALYALIVGMVGARTFFVVHHLDEFRGEMLRVVAIWRGGLEFVGGVVPAMVFLLFYLRRRHLPVRRYLDIMAVGLMMGLAFGRIGCFLNGCCFGRPSEVPWAVRFPYGSFAYVSQINPDPARDRPEPYLHLPAGEYLEFQGIDGRWYPKPLEELSRRQRREVLRGRYRCLPAHPTQLYASVNALLLCAILYVIWRGSSRRSESDTPPRRFRRPGLTVAVAFILYGVTRFVLEWIRDDNPFEIASLTISQVTSIGLVALGIISITVLASLRPQVCGPARVDTGATSDVSNAVLPSDER